MSGGGQGTAGRGRSRLTREGAGMLLLLGGFTLGALNTGTNLLYLVVALGANLLLLNFLLARGATGGLRLERRVPARVVAGAPAELRLTLAPLRGARPFPLRAQDLVARDAVAAPPRALFLGIGRGEAAEARYAATFLRRGWHALQGLRVSTRFPFGLVEHERLYHAPVRVLALPATRAVRRDLLPQARAAESLARRLVSPHERRDVVRGLRDLRPGDDPRAVHWRASARRGALVVKEFERVVPDAAVVLLDLVAADPATEDAAVGLAASLVVALLERGERTTLALVGAGSPAVLPGGEGLPARRRALEALAQAESAPDPDLRALLRRARSQLLGARVLAITTGPAGRLAGLLPAGARALVVGSPAAAEVCYEDGVAQPAREGPA